VFSHASNLPVSLAWEAFGIKNGAATLGEMRRRVGKYRGQADQHQDYTVGCRIVVQPVFLPPERWIAQPPSWGGSIVVGKTHSTDERDGRALWEAVSATDVAAAKPAPGFGEEQRRYGHPTLIAPRLGQGAFRIAVTDAYNRACAVSGGKVLPALDAAHIRPYGQGGGHEVSNGLLLRRDIHSVFDAGYVTIDEQLKFVVSDRVKTDFNNGNEYRRLHGTVVSVPTLPRFQPDLTSLRWHNETVFLG
jgi:putative restriction endonuclease